jgi:NDP-sugar pyrophosphorylase family protein
MKQVVILAGGLGTRLRPITEKIPKPMVPVAGQVFLHWQLKECLRQNYRRVLLLVSYLGEQIEAHFGDGSAMGLQISYSFEKEPLGTGGALKNAISMLEDQFIILNGDSFLRAPLSELEEFFDSSGAAALISTYDPRLATPVKENIVSRENRIVRYQKAGGREAGLELVDSGIYMMKKSLVEQCSALKFQIEELWPKLIEQQKLFSYPVDERFYDIGTPERLKEFEEKIHDYFANSLSN